MTFRAQFKQLWNYLKEMLIKRYAVHETANYRLAFEF